MIGKKQKEVDDEYTPMTFIEMIKDEIQTKKQK